MHQQVSKKILVYFFLFIIFGTLNNKNFTNSEIFRINNINVSGIENKNNLDLIKDLDLLKFQNIFFLDKEKIKKIIYSNPFIEKFSILKKYPSELEINIYKTKFLAHIKQENEIFFLGSNRKLIKTNKEIKNIPYIFGNFDDTEFFKFKEIIDSSNFDYKEIKNLFFFPSKRWDIETHTGVLIKLPKNELNNSLELALNMLSDINFKNIKIIDLRQKNQVITNE